jgi:hypothetical protein
MTALRGLLLASLLTACGSDDIDSDEEARRAYLALDGSIAKSIQLGFDGFNAASSANIDPQIAPGTDDGELTITGQVDQGSSDNKGMRLRVGMVGYTDGQVPIGGDETVFVVFDTDVDPALQPALDMQLKSIPDGTLTGTLVGTYLMSGDIEGEVDLNLSFSGELQDDGAGGTERVPGTTVVTGTALTTDDGSFTVEVTL